MSRTIKCLVLLTLAFVTSYCQHCQKEDGLCDLLDDEPSGHLVNKKPKILDNTKTDRQSDYDNQDLKQSVNIDHDTSSEDMWPKCVNFNHETFGKDNASIFVIEAKGRIGNHLMAYTLIKAFEAKLNIQVTNTNIIRT